jgi:phage shock protein C
MYRLRRVNKKEARLLGVCGGISKYLDPEMDPAIVRIIWVLLTIFSPPPMILFYFILGLTLKVEEPKEI